MQTYNVNVDAIIRKYDWSYSKARTNNLFVLNPMSDFNRNIKWLIIVVDDKNILQYVARHNTSENRSNENFFIHIKTSKKIKRDRDKLIYENPLISEVINNDRKRDDYDAFFANCTFFVLPEDKTDIITSIIPDVFDEQYAQLRMEELADDDELEEQPLNQILYGPPGTGKTYKTSEIIEKIISKNKNRTTSIYDKFADLTWHDAIALAMYNNNKSSYQVPDLKQLPEIQFVFKVKNNKNFKDALWSSLQTHTSPDIKTVKYARRVEPYLFEKDEASNWILTDEGRTYVEQQLSEFINEDSQVDYADTCVKDSDFYDFVTFHQSYSYEEFVEGIKPVLDENNLDTNMRFCLANGIFKQMCLKASSDPENNYVIVIDEINRGNVSKIFGELITLIEPDKRIGAEHEIVVTLPYSQKSFGVPKNLYIIGTMNTADKSLALLDVALRRRFDFVGIYPKYFIRGKNGENLVHHSEFLRKINEKILEAKDNKPDYLIGHAYFMNDDSLRNILVKKVIPLLMEYFNGDIKCVEGIFYDTGFDVRYNLNEYKWNVVEA